MDIQGFISAVAATLKWSMPLLAIVLLVLRVIHWLRRR